MDERELRRRKKKVKVYRMRFFRVLGAAGILILAALVVLAIFRQVHTKKQETVAMSDEELQILDDLKQQMTDKDFVLILDAGHGGSDVGTGSADYYEKDLNMDIVWTMKEMLYYCGVTVLLTRDGDETVTLEERSLFANESEADYFVSVHCNYCEEDASVAGLECYYWNTSPAGKAYADAIIHTAAENQEIGIRGTKTEDFHVLRETKLPAVLIETGYLSNSGERSKLYDKEYQQTLSVYLVKGIIEGYLQTETE
jgi:N-acetylmuramoyl-L-alanine amidase